MNLMRISLAALVLTLIVPIAEGATSSDDVSKLLFPETATWMPVARMAKAPESLLRRYEGQLKASYLKSAYANARSDNGVNDNSKCSFITRAFSKDYQFPSNFYFNDLNGDGYGEFFYAGSEHCSEGAITVIWVGGPNGYSLKSIANGLALRLQTGKEISLALVATGCCADPIDRYWTTAAPGLSNSIDVKSDTKFPSAGQPRKLFASVAEIALRNVPEISDKYDELSSEMNGQAVFGNMMSRYMPGATGVLISIAEGDKALSWCFGVMDKASDRLRLSAPFSARAGWFDCAAVKAVQGRQP